MLIQLLLFNACKIILLHWKNAVLPSVQQLFSLNNADLPKIKLINKGQACLKKFSKVWQLWLDISESFWGETPIFQ